MVAGCSLVLKSVLLAIALTLAVAVQATESPTPIADLLVDRDNNTIPDSLGQTVVVEGWVTVTPSDLSNTSFQTIIEDQSGSGIILFSPSLEMTFERGDRVRARGELSQHRGAPQLKNIEVELVGNESVPSALSVTLASVDGWQHMGKRVQVEGEVGPVSADVFGRMRLSSEDGSVLSLYFPPPVVADFDWQQWPRGSRISVTGVVSIYKQTWPYEGGFQLIVTRPEDIRLLAPPQPAWQRWAQLSIAPASALLVIALFVNYRVQRRAKARAHELATLTALSASFSTEHLDQAQLARSATDILTAYDIAELACVFPGIGAAASATVVFTAHDSEIAESFEAELGRNDPGQDAQAVADFVQRLAATLSLQLIALHPLTSSHDGYGFICAFALQRRKPSALQERTLYAAARLLALALENQRVRHNALIEQQKLHQLVVTDDLTGLYNRRFLDEYLRVQLPLAQRRGSGLAFVALDIDFFKRINDEHGHAAGDRVLAGVAAVLRQTCRSSDLIARVGGEEFLIIINDAEQGTALPFCERIRNEVAASEFDLDGTRINVTVSIGIAIFGVHADDIESLHHAADMALYAAKRAGRNRCAWAAEKAA
ncbi:diguanylate cyclase [Pseudomarimonas arenosa]|uniref:diguanylate cyclase n=1 Tax=Pseudomarimonas arenosa TaxID=2774145 RepID=A0AAW3ZTE7_9GAMM|nr:diguanylate cyclase [Pseudomarimonas arenosa]MBD8528234.1 diguanylate cyclase [Pseudomarimonas arenosa]